ncbi:MAG: nuclease-related domain-containing protein [Chloroflexota bacterium]
MKIIKNYSFMSGRRTLGTGLSFAGIAVLLAGFFFTFNETSGALRIFSLFSLPLGFIISQGGLYFANRYVRQPVIADAIDMGFDRIGNAGKGVRLYHYVLPVPHLILGPSGVIVIVPRFQGGDITADGYEWKQKLGLFNRIFGQQALPNPAVEAETRLKQLAKWISHNVPDLAETELPIGAIIVFTTKDSGTLDVRKSAIPAMHYTKLKGFWKQRQKDERLDQETYVMLQTAFDAEAEKKGIDLEEE